MWGIIPAAGKGSRIQPLAFSKELLPIGSRLDGVIERPRAVCEYLIERMLLGGADKITLVISPGKSDIMEYFGGKYEQASFCYMVQSEPKGLCDAVFSALPIIPYSENVLIGLPDTIWFPEEGYSYLPDDILSFLLFPVTEPQLFDAVITDNYNRVMKIEVKQKNPESNWIWGAFKMPASILYKLYDLWIERKRSDEYMGTLVNAYIDQGGYALGVKSGDSYVDVGTVFGYREAIKLLHSETEK